MIVQLNGYDMYSIDERRYHEFIEILGIENDLFLDMMQMQKEFNVVPVLSINVETIDKEGPIPYSHHQTEIGAKRMSTLLEKQIISPYPKES